MTDDSSPKISVDEANAICRELLPIGDEVFTYMSQLQEAGFAAFLPRHRFIEAFAETPTELDLHRRYVKEYVKLRLGQPFPIRMSDEDVAKLYIPPFIQQLREERDKANGLPMRELSTRYPPGECAWRREIDPCQRRLIQMSVSDPQLHEERFTAMLEAEHRALEEEAGHHATGLGRIPHTFDQKGRYAFFKAVMEREAAPLGFHYDKKRSRPTYPLFSKALTEDWSLSWAIEDPRFFFHSPVEGKFAPRLELRSKALRGTLEKAVSGQYLIFPYAVVVPGFIGGYWTFFDLDELETAIKAQLYFYSLMAPIMESGIKKVIHS